MTGNQNDQYVRIKDAQTDMVHAFQAAREMQCGAVTLIAVILLITVVTFSALVAALYTNTGVNDALNQDDSIAALFLAETGLENAAYNLSVSGTCDATGVGVGITVFGRGSFEIVSGTVSGTLCQITTYGIIGSVRRTVQADVRAGGAIAILGTPAVATPSSSGLSSITYAYTVAAGTNRVLIVTTAYRDNANVFNATVTYGGVAMTSVIRRNFTSGGQGMTSQIFRLINPTVGTANVVVNYSIFGFPASTRSVTGAIAFSNVDQTTPIEATASNGAVSNAPSVTATPLTNGAWILDSISREGGGTFTMTAAANRTQAWNTQTGNGAPHAGGAVSYRGPINPAAATAMAWTWTAVDSWAAAGVAIRPATTGGTASVVTWTEQ